LTDVTGQLRFDKMTSGNAAVYLLREEFEKFFSSGRKVDTCEWIAHCFYQLEQFGDAGAWYETAGRLVLADPTTPSAIKAITASRIYEKALDCYRHSDDVDTITECSEMLRDLRRACAPA
jgi:hypothetical protein